MNMLKWIEEELSGIDPSSIENPEDAVAEGEEVVGILVDLQLRRLSILLERLVGEHAEVIESARKLLEEKARGWNQFEEETDDHDPMTCQGCTMLRQVKVLSDKIEAVNVLFWGSVRTSVPESVTIKFYKAGGVGIRKDWQIVVLPKREPDFLSILRAGNFF